MLQQYFHLPTLKQLQMLLIQQNDAFCKTFHTKQCNQLILSSFLYGKITKGEFSVAKRQEIVTFNVYNDDEGFNFVHTKV